MQKNIVYGYITAGRNSIDKNASFEVATNAKCTIPVILPKTISFGKNKCYAEGSKGAYNFETGSTMRLAAFSLW
jgi:hypothetical protein